jgi:hypothetical protein
MKTTHKTLIMLVFLFLVSGAFIFKSVPAEEKNGSEYIYSETIHPLDGAWKLSQKKGDAKASPTGATAIKIIAGGRFAVVYFDQEEKKFIGTYGGTYTLSGNRYTETYDFNTWDSTQVGTSATLSHTLAQDRWQLSGSRAAGPKGKETWQRIDNGTEAPLAGAWQITGRDTGSGEMRAITPGPRKTIKMLSGTRFQWIAFNTETRQFMGTGGGTYTARDGKYTENIEFFSRDASRVGAQLSFDFEVKGNNWHHSGLSSSGNPINEIWTKE